MLISRFQESFSDGEKMVAKYVKKSPDESNGMLSLFLSNMNTPSDKLLRIPLHFHKKVLNVLSEVSSKLALFPEVSHIYVLR